MYDIFNNYLLLWTHHCSKRCPFWPPSDWMYPEDERFPNRSRPPAVWLRNAKKTVGNTRILYKYPSSLRSSRRNLAIAGKSTRAAADFLFSYVQQAEDPIATRPFRTIKIYFLSKRSQLTFIMTNVSLYENMRLTTFGRQWRRRSFSPTTISASMENVTNNCCFCESGFQLLFFDGRPWKPFLRNNGKDGVHDLLVRVRPRIRSVPRP